MDLVPGKLEGFYAIDLSRMLHWVLNRFDFSRFSIFFLLTGADKGNGGTRDFSKEGTEYFVKCREVGVLH